jgi:DNA polymerase-3 subunit delta'
MARTPKLEEERPPHDALAGVALPRQTTSLIGHQEAERTLLDAFRSGHMHHAWLLVGQRGIGKATLAFRMARFILAHPDPAAVEVQAAEALQVAADDPRARRLAAGVHADLLHLQREWDERRGRYRTGLSVESIRRIIPLLGGTAGEGGWRVVIIDPADDMTVSAANALLKNLEEPPKRTLFLLLARSRGALLPTILSRCRTLHLQPLSPQDMLAVVRAAAPDISEEKDLELAVELARGSPRRLIELMRNDGIALYRLMLKAIEDDDPRAQLELSARAGASDTANQLLELYEDYLARRVYEARQGSAASDVSLVTCAELWEKAAHSGRDVETYNLDRRQYVLDLLETSAAALRQSGVPDRA